MLIINICFIKNLGFNIINIYKIFLNKSYSLIIYNIRDHLIFELQHKDSKPITINYDYDDLKQKLA